MSGLGGWIHKLLTMWWFGRTPETFLSCYQSHHICGYASTQAREINHNYFAQIYLLGYMNQGIFFKKPCHHEIWPGTNIFSVWIFRNHYQYWNIFNLQVKERDTGPIQANLGKKSRPFLYNRTAGVNTLKRYSMNVGDLFPHPTHHPSSKVS